MTKNELDWVYCQVPGATLKRNTDRTKPYLPLDGLVPSRSLHETVLMSHTNTAEGAD